MSTDKNKRLGITDSLVEAVKEISKRGVDPLINEAVNYKQHRDGTSTWEPAEQPWKKHGITKMLEEDAPTTNVSGGNIAGTTPDTLGVSKKAQQKYRKKNQSNAPSMMRRKSFRGWIDG